LEKESIFKKHFPEDMIEGDIFSGGYQRFDMLLPKGKRGLYAN